MNSKNPIKSDIERALDKYQKSSTRGNFDALYMSVTQDYLLRELSKKFPGYWKLMKLYNSHGGIEGLKNDVLLGVYKDAKKDKQISSLPVLFEKHLLLFIGSNTSDIALALHQMLEYSFSLTYRDFFEFEKIDHFGNFILMEIFSVIYESLYEMIQEGSCHILYHLILLLSKEQTIEITKESDFTKTLIDEMRNFWKRVEKSGIFSLISIFIKGVGDMDEFQGLLAGHHLIIFQERAENKKSYTTIDQELNLINSREHLYKQLNTYIKGLDLIDEILEEDENIKYSGALWKILNPALSLSETDFVSELFERENNRSEFEKTYGDKELTWGMKRKLEQEFNFPEGYIEQYFYRTPIVDLFSSF